MSAKEAGQGFQEVLLVADLFDPGASDLQIAERRDLERTDLETFLTLKNTIESLGLGVRHCAQPSDLRRYTRKAKHSIVLSIYGGAGSRNRMALVPAVAEALGLKFIGPDAYGRITAQDKEISKRLALDCGLRTPAWRIARDLQGIDRAISLNYPAIVKPLMEGSSIGISQRNLVRSGAEARRVSAYLLEMFSQPVLIEEFVPGREVSFSSIQGASHSHWAFSEVVIEGDASFFETHLFDAHEKQWRTEGRTVHNIDAELSSEDRTAIERLLAALGKYGYCRVDGRLTEGRFHFLELTPDAWIHPRGQFAMGFTEKGWSYQEVVAAVLSSAG